MVDVKELGVPAYVVGGWVRDRLLGRSKAKWDLDFVLPHGAVETARAIATKHQAGFVVLDKQRQIARVVFKDGTADFAQQVGDSIITDLGYRDFTMNAIAIDCQQLRTLANFTDTSLIDPHGGQQALQNRSVQMIACANIQADPIRILRGYRQAAQLGFHLEQKTKACLQENAKLLGQVAPERVRLELSYLLAAEAHWLAVVVQDGILEEWLPSRFVNLPRLAQVDRAVAIVTAAYPSLEAYFERILSSDRSCAVIIKLAAMTTSANALAKFGFSKLEQKWILTLLRHLPRFLEILDHSSPCQTYELFASTGEMFPALAILAIANGVNLKQIKPWLERWLDPHDPLAHLVPILTGDDLKTELGLRSGQLIGNFLHKLKLAQADGVIFDHNSAIAYAKSLITMSEAETLGH